MSWFDQLVDDILEFMRRQNRAIAEEAAFCVLSVFAGCYHIVPGIPHHRRSIILYEWPRENVLYRYMSAVIDSLCDRSGIYCADFEKLVIRGESLSERHIHAALSDANSRLVISSDDNLMWMRNTGYKCYENSIMSSCNGVRLIPPTSVFENMRHLRKYALTINREYDTSVLSDIFANRWNMTDGTISRTNFVLCDACEENSVVVQKPYCDVIDSLMRIYSKHCNGIDVQYAVREYINDMSCADADKHHPYVRAITEHIKDRIVSNARLICIAEHYGKNCLGIPTLTTQHIDAAKQIVDRNDNAICDKILQQNINYDMFAMNQ